MCAFTSILKFRFDYNELKTSLKKFEFLCHYNELKTETAIIMNTKRC